VKASAWLRRKAWAGLLLSLCAGVCAAQVPAKKLFGKATEPAAMAAAPIGYYSKGCLAGAQALPADGAHWQVMRPARKRNWGHPALIAFLERFAPAAAQASGWPGILVGDLAQPRGGPMLTGHASHQLGLDADIWYLPMPVQRMSASERENLSSVSLVRADRLEVEPATWTPGHAALLRTAAADGAVQRIFVNPAIKKALCASDKGAPWLRKIRPEHGHDYHFHVRLHCPAGASQCESQEPPPEGDGCDASLDWWFTHEALHPQPSAPAAPLTLAKLPAACTSVLSAGRAKNPR